MESENTFHLKKKPSAPIPQYVNPGKARKGASRRRAFRSLPRERFLCRLGPFRPPHEIHRRDGLQPTVPCGSFRTGGHVPFCVLQSHSSGVEYIFPTPFPPHGIFHSSAGPRPAFRNGLHLCEGLPGRFSGTKSPHSGNGSRRIKGTSEFPFLPPEAPRGNQKEPSAPCGKSGAAHPYASCRRPGTGTRLRPSLPEQPAAGPERQARTVAPRVLFLGILHRRQAALLDRRVCAVSGNRVLRQVQH